MLETIALGAAVGIAATVTMDVLASLSRRFGIIVGAKGTWVGRWYLGMARGRFAHANIADAPELPGEIRIAMFGHYLIGTLLAVLYVVGTDWLGVASDRVLSALGFGVATCVFPWLLMYPCFGFGLFGVRGPSELRLFTTSLVNHFFYGFGIWWAAALLPFS